MVRRKKDKLPEVSESSMIMLKGRILRRVIGDRGRSHIVCSVHDLMEGVYSGIENLVADARTWKRAGNVEDSIALFGLNRPDSSLMKPRIQWKMSLSERIATETLSRLLNAGGSNASAPRIEAFLRALGLGESELGIGEAGLRAAQVFSEVPTMDGRRIDLKIVWRDDNDQNRVLVVEAKFEHVITDGQLRCYRNSTKQSHPNAKRLYLILAFSEDAQSMVKYREDGKWLFCSWRDLWLRFETTRPVEDDLNLQLFLHALWRRIGQLNPRDAYAAL